MLQFKLTENPKHTLGSLYTDTLTLDLGGIMTWDGHESTKGSL